jgi:hypothetical protein
MDLELFLHRVENPRMQWSESYEMYGERKPYTLKYADLSDFDNYYLFKAKCKICGQFSEVSQDSNEAIFNHFAHCSRFHGYIFDGKHPIKDLEDVDQQLIRTAMIFDLPNPGFEDHENCVKQYSSGKIVCAIHY